MTRFLDITTPPTPNMLQFFASCANNPVDKKNLTELATVKHTLLYTIIPNVTVFSFVCSAYRTAQLTKIGVTITYRTFWKSFESFPPLIHRLPYWSHNLHRYSQDSTVYLRRVYCTRTKYISPSRLSLTGLKVRNNIMSR